MNKDRKAYFENYYQEKKGELLQRRNERYKSDPEYREKAKERARAWRAKKKQQRDEEREKLRAEGKLENEGKRPRKPVLVIVGGRTLTAYPMKIVAEKLDRSVGAINYWSKIGLLPHTPIRTKGGNRLYTEGMILVMQMAISRRGRISKTDTTFRDEIIAGWEELGIPVDKTDE